ncbi:hypothetical protein [Poseidonocella sp. HB161398]|uniref:hypothetical protein n=1 Tax=Poseidonocella sp. HB161398 TaxID=2320855 RepID=UPI001108AAA7|nr:hypothetical protein [Poseidonocella sp. HB161398]
MTRQELEAFGIALYGPQWVTPLARDLRELTGGPANRTMQRWAAGTHDIPETLRPDLERLAAATLARIEAARAALIAPGKA